MNEWIENHTSKPFIVNHFDPNFKDRPMYSQFTHYRNMNCSAMSFLGTGKRSISQIKVPLLWSATPCSTTYYYYYSLYIPSHSGNFLASSAWSSIFEFKYWYFFPQKNPSKFWNGTLWTFVDPKIDHCELSPLVTDRILKIGLSGNRN